MNAKAIKRINKNLQNVPDAFFEEIDSFINYIKFRANTRENPTNDLSLSEKQLEDLDDRIENAKAEDFISWEAAKKQLKL